MQLAGAFCRSYYSVRACGSRSVERPFQCRVTPGQTQKAAPRSERRLCRIDSETGLKKENGKTIRFPSLVHWCTDARKTLK